jgi:hypothetical protein
MKKTILLLVVVLLCLQYAALSQKTRVAVVGGVTISSMSGQLGGNDNNYEKKPGFTLGLMIDAPVTDHISFFPGLHYVQKGTHQRPPVGTLITKSYISLRYVELNGNFIYHSNGSKGNFFIGAGPSLGFKVPSKKGTQIDDEKTESDVNFGNSIDKDIKGVDYGVNFLLGFRMSKGFMVTGNYNYGIRDLRPVDESGPDEIHNMYFGIQIGWLFNNK